MNFKAEKLQELRKIFNKSQRQVAEELCCALRSYINYEQNVFPMPSKLCLLLFYLLQKWRSIEVKGYEAEIAKLQDKINALNAIDFSSFATKENTSP